MEEEDNNDVDDDDMEEENEEGEEGENNFISWQYKLQVIFLHANFCKISYMIPFFYH